MTTMIEKISLAGKTEIQRGDAVADEHLKLILENRWTMIDAYLSDFHINSRDLGSTIVKKPVPMIALAEEDVEASKAELKKEIEFALKIAFQEGVKAGMASERQRNREEKAGLFARARQWILR